MDDVGVGGADCLAKLLDVAEAGWGGGGELGGEGEGLCELVARQAALAEIGDFCWEGERVGIDAQGAGVGDEGAFGETDQAHARAGGEDGLQGRDDVEEDALGAAEEADGVEEEDSQFFGPSGLEVTRIDTNEHESSRKNAGAAGTLGSRNHRAHRDTEGTERFRINK
jgi:hypothetical protein